MRTIRSRGAKRACGERRRQRDVLCAVMLSASQCETWLTLDELAKLTHYPPASISAQLRHLRKPEFGGYQVKKRQRKLGRAMRGEDFGTVWEYQLRRGVRRVLERRRTRQARRDFSGVLNLEQQSSVVSVQCSARKNRTKREV